MRSINALADTQTHATAGDSESNSSLPSLHEFLANQPVSMIVLDRIEVHLTRPGSEPSAKLKEEWVQIANKQRGSSFQVV